MGVTERERLAPEAFRLPVEKIREGYYSDAYFNYAKATAGGRTAATRGC